MTNIADLMKCPECFVEGRFEIIIYTKEIVAACENCGHTEYDRVPYPKHRSDHEGYQYQFRVGDVRPISAHGDDETTCSQEEWDEKYK